MPIDYKKYPPNWKTEIRPRILKRSHNACELCGVENKAIIRRDKRNPAVYMYAERMDMNKLTGLQKLFLENNYSKAIKIILTIAHLDHDPENWGVKDERLKALCQRCHLNYDREQKRNQNGCT